jgi:hypothetical protein
MTLVICPAIQAERIFYGIPKGLGYFDEQLVDIPAGFEKETRFSSTLK